MNEKIDGWWRSTSTVTFAVRPVDTAVGATNPEWQGSVWIVSAPLLTAQFGQASGGSLTLQGDGALTRAVA